MLSQWSNILLLLYTTSQYFTVVLSRSCTAAIYKQLYPCGDVNRYQQLTGFKRNLLHFKKAGAYCYASSRSGNFPKVFFETSLILCKQRGSRLAWFPFNRDWASFTRLSKDQVDKYEAWVHGRLYGSDWWWGNKEKMITTNNWGRHQPEGGNQGCMMIRKNKWHDARCRRKYKFVCQREIEAAYNTKTAVDTVAPDGKGRRKFKTGEVIQLTCTSRSEKGLRLKISTQSYGDYTVHSHHGSNTQPDEKFGASVMNDGIHYTYSYERCFRYYHLKLNVILNTRLHQATILCDHLNTTVRGLQTAFTIEVSFEVKKPYVELQGLPTGRTLPAYKDRFTYLCQGRLGFERGGMTFALVHKNQLWVKLIDHLGAQSSAGTRPPWFDRLDISHVTGFDPIVLGSYVNLSITFELHYEMTQYDWVCFSKDVTGTARQTGLVKKSDDPLGLWTTFTKNHHIKQATLQIYNLTREMILGMSPTIHCDQFVVVCSGSYETKEFLSFVVNTTEKVFSWRYGSPSTLPSWAPIKYIQILEDKIRGPIFRIVVKMTVLPQTSIATLSCIDDYYKDRPLVNSKRLNFDSRGSVGTGALPPVLTSRRLHEGDARLTLKCKTQLGQGYIQSWEIEDTEANRGEILKFNKNINESSSSFPWLRVTMTDASDNNSYCGVIIVSQLRVYRAPPKKDGIKFTCHSYDIHKAKLISSERLRLSASYEFGGTGYTGSYEEEEEDEYHISALTTALDVSWFAMLLIASGGALFVYLYMRSSDTNPGMKKKGKQGKVQILKNPTARHPDSVPYIGQESTPTESYEQSVTASSKVSSGRHSALSHGTGKHTLESNLF